MFMERTCSPFFLRSVYRKIYENTLSFRKIWSAGGYKSQIFVRKSNSPVKAINIDLFSLGNNLYDVLAQELGEDVTKCNLVFGTKEVYCYVQSKLRTE